MSAVVQRAAGEPFVESMHSLLRSDGAIDVVIEVVREETGWKILRVDEDNGR